MKLANVIGLAAALQATAATPVQRSTTVSGFYIPHHDGHWPSVDFKKEYSKGARFVFIRGTGSKSGDTQFNDLWSDAKGAGIVRGAVHNIHPHEKKNATAQGDDFAAGHGKWVDDGYTLPGSLHLGHREGHRKCFGLSHDAMVQWIGDFAKAYQGKSTRYPILLTTDAWWKNCTGDSDAFKAESDLGIIHRAKTVGTLPRGWTTWTFWHHGDGGAWGALGNEFNGDEAALQAFAKGS